MGGARRLAGLGGALLLVAAALDVEPLYVPGVALLALAAGAAGWVALVSRRITVGRTLTRATALEEQPVRVTVTARSSGLLLPHGTVHDPLLGTPLPLAAGGWEHIVPIEVRFSRRGRHVLAPPAVVVRDPFGLAHATVTGRAAEILVLPAVLPVRRPGGDQAGDALGRRSARDGIAPEVELDGLRPLRPGTPASRISWAALARTGDLLERHLRPDGDARPVVVLDTRTASGEDEPALDAAVRAAASLCVHLGRREGCALLLPGDRRPHAIDHGLAGWPPLHTRLALVRAGGAPAAGALGGRTGIVFHVSARPLVRPPATLTRAGGHVLVVPVALPGRPPSFTVAGCLGYDLTVARGRRPEAA